MTRTLYAAWPERARRSWGWAAILLVAGFYLLGAIGYALGQLAWLIASRGPGVLSEPGALQAGLANLPPAGVLFVLLFIQFAAWGGLTLLWMAGFERRGLATIGLGGKRAGARFFGGVLLAGAIILLLGLAVSIISVFWPVEATREFAEADWGRLADPGLWLLFLAIAVFFLFQGGVEELVFRGWLMSTLAARWGVAASVIVSSLVFALFHAHVFLSGLVNGATALLGIAMTGLFLALLAVRQGTIWGVVGLHGAFNALTLLSALAYELARRPDTPVGAVITGVFEQATGMEAGAAFQPQALAQALVFGALAVLLVWRMRRRPA